MERLKYPLLMVHGMGFRDNRVISYWGRIPKALENAVRRCFSAVRTATVALRAMRLS